MKRFWSKAEIAHPSGEDAAGNYGILLDGRPLRTPKKNLLHVPTLPLAEAIAAEWNAVEDKVQPDKMALTGIANAACDIVTADTQCFAQNLARYAESDLLCYRADGPEPLINWQAEEWDPLLDWMQKRFDLGFEVTTGIMHVAQPPETLERVRAIFEAFPPMELAALSLHVEIAGSAIIALALAEGAISLEDAFQAAVLDELWQEKYWGADKEATTHREQRYQQFAAAFQFFKLARMEGPTLLGASQTRG